MSTFLKLICPMPRYMVFPAKIARPNKHQPSKALKGVLDCSRVSLDCMVLMVATDILVEMLIHSKPQIGYNDTRVNRRRKRERGSSCVHPPTTSLFLKRCMRVLSQSTRSPGSPFTSPGLAAIQQKIERTEAKLTEVENAMSGGGTYMGISDPDKLYEFLKAHATSVAELRKQETAVQQTVVDSIRQPKRQKMDDSKDHRRLKQEHAFTA
ncbi:EsV-1-205 [Ectocarpus siliculosus virus 1]|uniref:EsV-1-205 n=1 Tax=Ectocarpus siliculosus virus 1 (isolate New Zealand/Kaikoura/1988) TaxID=654926 RepID=Q8QN84_ESV1K|nr:EsV-1-205 [Ectocarpus siliculosus virus 1]AAK14619.1 EsV-1-205 [Ectocarpus siliculosus virus 1]